MEEKDGRMRARSGGDVKESVELGSVTGELKRVHDGRMGLVGDRVGSDGRRSLGVEKARKKSAGEKYGGLAGACIDLPQSGHH